MRNFLAIVIVFAALWLGVMAWRNRSGWQASLVIGLFVISWGIMALATSTSTVLNLTEGTTPVPGSSEAAGA